MSIQKHEQGEIYDVVLLAESGSNDPVKATYMGNNIWAVVTESRKELLGEAFKNGGDNVDTYEKTYATGSSLSFEGSLGITVSGGINFIVKANVEISTAFKVNHTSFEQEETKLPITLNPGQCGAFIQQNVSLNLYRDIVLFSFHNCPTVMPLKGDQKSANLSFGMIETIVGESEEELYELMANM